MASWSLRRRDERPRPLKPDVGLQREHLACTTRLGASSPNATVFLLMCAAATGGSMERDCRNPVGVGDTSLAPLPRVARCSQPWAERCNPFGIERKPWLQCQLAFLLDFGFGAR